MKLDAEDIEAIASRVIEKINGNRPAPELTIHIDAARNQTGHETRSGFRTWAAKWKLKPCASCMYPMDSFKLALARAAFITPEKKKAA